MGNTNKPPGHPGEEPEEIAKEIAKEITSEIDAYRDSEGAEIVEVLLHHTRDIDKDSLRDLASAFPVLARNKIIRAVITVHGGAAVEEWLKAGGMEEANLGNLSLDAKNYILVHVIRESRKESVPPESSQPAGELQRTAEETVRQVGAADPQGQILKKTDSRSEKKRTAIELIRQQILEAAGGEARDRSRTTIVGLNQVVLAGELGTSNTTIQNWLGEIQDWLKEEGIHLAQYKSRSNPRGIARYAPAQLSPAKAGMDLLEAVPAPQMEIAAARETFHLEITEASNVSEISRGIEKLTALRKRKAIAQLQSALARSKGETEGLVTILVQPQRWADAWGVSDTTVQNWTQEINDWLVVNRIVVVHTTPGDRQEIALDRIKNGIISASKTSRKDSQGRAVVEINQRAWAQELGVGETVLQDWLAGLKDWLAEAEIVIEKPF